MEELNLLNMKKYLGRAITVYKNNGDSFFYKPDGFVKGTKADGDQWTGYDDEMIPTFIRRDEIMAVKENE